MTDQPEHGATPQQGPPPPSQPGPPPPPSQQGPAHLPPSQPGPPPAPAANPYGGYTQAPSYAGGRPMHPGSVGYVEQYFGPVAGFGQRALGLIVDMLLTLIGLVPMVIGFIVLLTAAPSVVVDETGSTVTTGGDGTSAAIGGLLIALGGLLMLAITLWNRVFRMGRTGQSVGKSVVGLRLVDDKTGQPIGAGMCFLREIVLGLVNQVFYLGYLWMLWDTDRQTLGDKAVHSTVVVLPKQR
jgi:uncharacterized RDD family membrane protein YckC